ncbi:SDR family NAD(P)-dependent oxidoreductase [Trinickia caryophylli]|uniref:Short-chain dehydrogenase n=1 Tax=Trinickia caryophylli TaxID=28094 RepID=A0A1X7CUJ9_TRICW|nr:SDR family NAD(P)-dependent oxidoreductase [Trinickia caryophylli]PMS13391.1 KR domain-containing protein [Trinickia caryophylli]TRX13750.1 SDR family NAD(P)-dependent oxidoreductase [Trinickia caryophylli]WQE15343.1 SDR family NAD(P)-dependent oxidoreductase [Trinickia caryophylli]SMF03340.1 Short-chain dehydrogenase [Trinickia caryophylli]GLU30897.1 short-chain dehydrogenase/reductase [Trinickia caryophylli]
MKNFTGKVAAITGAGSGIGRALALALAREGCHLALADREPSTLDDTAQLVNAAAGASEARPVRMTTSVLDVADCAAVESWAAETAEHHGQVNLVFNNAGVALSSTVEGMDYADLQWIVGVNFWGVVHGTKAFLPYLKAAGDGHIVNTSSVFGLFAQPGMSAYNATKFAVRGFTESLRQELDLMRCGVSATCVHPGGVRTNIAQASRISSNMLGFLIEDERQGRDDFERFFITSPDDAARVILDGVRHDKRRVLIGRDARAADRLVRFMPAAYQAVVAYAAGRLRRQRAARHGRAAGSTLSSIGEKRS